MSAKRRPSKLERQVRTVVAMFQERSDWRVEDIRDRLRLRACDDHQPIIAAAIDAAPFEIVYVYERPDVWTCASTAEIRQEEAYQLARQDATKWHRRLRRQERFRHGERLTGSLSMIASEATANAETLATNRPDPDREDSCLMRIDRWLQDLADEA